MEGPAYSLPMGTIGVRVSPRSLRSGLGLDSQGVSIRVRSDPEDGRATEEARRILARALGVAPSTVSLRSGAKSRSKLFTVEGMTGEEIEARLRGS